MMDKLEVMKYVWRFGLLTLLFVPLVYFTQGEQTVKLVAYKIILITTGIGLAEMIWAVFFKPYFGRIEERDDKLAVLLFRGLLYSSIIISLAMGL
jgi:hypothetical protein